MLPLLSIVTVPVTAACVLPARRGGAAAGRRSSSSTLVLFQLLPLLIGIASDEAAQRRLAALRAPSQIVSSSPASSCWSLLAPKFASGVASVYGSNGMWAMLCIACCCRWSPDGFSAVLLAEDRRVLAIGTALRKSGSALVIATTNFRGTMVVAAVIDLLLVSVRDRDDRRHLFRAHGEGGTGDDAADPLAVRFPDAHDRRLHLADRGHDERVQRRAAGPPSRPLQALHRDRRHHSGVCRRHRRRHRARHSGQQDSVAARSIRGI